MSCCFVCGWSSTCVQAKHGCGRAQVVGTVETGDRRRVAQGGGSRGRGSRAGAAREAMRTSVRGARWAMLAWAHRQTAMAKRVLGGGRAGCSCCCVGSIGCSCSCGSEGTTSTTSGQHTDVKAPHVSWAASRTMPVVRPNQDSGGTHSNCTDSCTCHVTLNGWRHCCKSWTRCACCSMLGGCIKHQGCMLCCKNMHQTCPSHPGAAAAALPLPAAHLADHQVAPALRVVHGRVDAHTEKVLVHGGLQQQSSSTAQHLSCTCMIIEQSHL